MIDIHILPIIESNSNYAYVVRAPEGNIAVIDPGDAAPIIEFLDERDWKPDVIINTHHHWDHVNGNPALQKKYGIPVYAPEKDAHRIKHVDHMLKDGDVFELGSEKALVIETPGHTMGEICLWFKDSNALFTGDTLFSMGCGRLFEGSAQDMFSSFQKIAALPDETMIYCGHEYTRSNAGFCLSQEPDNPALRARIDEVKALRAANKPTIPVSLKTEKETNVFMRAKNADEFGRLRALKDKF